MGKDWAKGLTAGTDARVARNAQAHIGRRHGRATPPYLRKNRSHDRNGPLGWSPETAYMVGLAATDGCLAKDGRHVDFTSADLELVQTFLRLVRSRTRIGEKSEGVYRAQVGDVELYCWLQSIGLMPRKSLVLGPVDVPDHLFLDLVRGLLDGDGSILNFRYRGTGKANHERLYESLLAVFISASHRHLEWLRAGLARRLGIRGSLQRRRMKSGNYCSRLAYAKRESLVLLPLLYADPAAPRLMRKWRIWEDFRRRHSELVAGATRS